MSPPANSRVTAKPPRQNVAIVLSESSRHAYVDEAERRQQVYAFTDAWGEQRTWLKGEWAYLAPNALSSILLRFNVKHDIVDEGALVEALPAYHTLFVPNAAALASDAVRAIEHWSGDPDHRLIVTGKTNLAPDLLGLRELSFTQPDGYTGWQWTADSPFADPSTWEPSYLCSYRGYTAGIARAAADATIFAQLVDYSGDLRRAATATITQLGDAIVRSPNGRVLYIANQFLEYLGGVFQAHLNVEEVRMQYNASHWGDTLAFFFREILHATGSDRLWQTRLRSFGAYNGVLQLRHDADIDPDEQIDLSMLTYQVQNIVPATHYVMDPLYCGPERCTLAATKIWIEAGAKHNFIEIATHNDSTQGDPPRNIIGQGLATHVADSDRRLGLRSRTIGRHMGFLVYPETIDAMDYLYAHDPEFLGMCTFSLYDVLEYGDPHPSAPAHGKLVTYATYDHDDPARPAAISGYWFPYHAVVATADRRTVLPGWDVTHDTDCDYDRIDCLFDGRNSRNREVPSALDQAVFTLHYEQQAANRVTVNDGRGHLPFVRYAIESAHRHNFWLANKQQLYQRLKDYEAVSFRLEADGALTLHNPTHRLIRGLMVELPAPGPYAGLVAVDGSAAYPHVVAGRLVTLPPLSPGTTIRLVPVQESASGPYLTQPSTNRLEIVTCQRNITDGRREVLTIEGQLAQQGFLHVQNLQQSATYAVLLNDNRGEVTQRLVADGDGALVLTLFGPRDNFVSFHAEVALASEP